MTLASRQNIKSVLIATATLSQAENYPSNPRISTKKHPALCFKILVSFEKKEKVNKQEGCTTNLQLKRGAKLLVVQIAFVNPRINTK